MPEVLGYTPESYQELGPRQEVAALNQELLPRLKEYITEGKLGPYDLARIREYDEGLFTALNPSSQIWDKLKQENERTQLEPAKYVMGLDYLRALDPEQFQQEIALSQDDRTRLEHLIPRIWEDYQKVYESHGQTMVGDVPDVFRVAKATRRVDPLLFKARIENQEVFQKEMLPRLTKITEQAKTQGNAELYLALVEIAYDLLPEKSELLQVEPGFWQQIKTRLRDLAQNKPLDFFRYAKAASQLQIATRK